MYGWYRDSGLLGPAASAQLHTDVEYPSTQYPVLTRMVSSSSIGGPAQESGRACRAGGARVEAPPLPTPAPAWRARDRGVRPPGRRGTAPPQIPTRNLP